jgi:hypothetical protein
MTITPEVLEQEFSLPTAVTRLDFLSRRDSGSTNSVVEPVDADDWSTFKDATTSLDVPESLELLALGEVIARKAHDAQLVGIRAALREGAGWDRIAAAMDTTPAGAWDAFHHAIDRALAQARRTGEGLDEASATAARRLAGDRPAV